MMFRLSLASIILAVAPLCLASGVVAPSAFTTTSGNYDNSFPFFGPGAGDSQRYQQVYSGSDFMGLGGPVLLSSIAFRPSNLYFDATAHDIDFNGSISLSTTSLGEDSLGATFADNVGANAATVFSGKTTMSTSYTPVAGGTYEFDLVINFATPFLFDPSQGNLLLDVTNVSDIVHSTLYLDANDESGDGTSRVWSSGTISGTPDSLGVIARFGTQAVPEPAPVVALGLGVLGLLKRRKRAA